MKALRTASEIRRDKGILSDDNRFTSAIEVAINNARRELIDYLTYRENEDSLMRITKMKFSEIAELKASLK